MSFIQNGKAKLFSIFKKIPFGAHTIRLIHRNPLYKGVLIIGSGTAIAQLIGILSMPVITRIYSPEDLGILAVYSSTLAIFGIGATLRYEFSFGLPEEENDAAHLLILCMVLLFVTTTILGIFLFYGSEILFNFFKEINVIRQYLLILLIGFFLTGLYTILNYWAIRQRSYKFITVTKITQGIGGAVSKIFLGLLFVGPLGLIIGHILSQTAGISTLINAMWRTERNKFKRISLKKLGFIAAKYKSFPILNFPSSVLNASTLQLPPILLLAIFDARTAGFYALAHSLLLAPGTIISNSMGQAYLGEATKMIRDRSTELRKQYIQTLKHLTMVAIPLIGIPAISAPFFVPIIFGNSWSEAGWYCWPLGIMTIASFVVPTISPLSIFGYNHWKLLWDTTRLISCVISFYLGIILGKSIIVTLLFYSIAMFILYLVLVVISLKAIKSVTQNRAFEEG